MSVPSLARFKRCTKCRVLYPHTAEYFHLDKKGARGLSGQCKCCCIRRSRLYYETNKAEVLAKGKIYRQNNKEAINARNRAWENKNREAFKAHRAAYMRKRNATPKGRAAVAIQNRQRKLKRLAAEGRHTAEDVRRHYEVQGGKCYWCQVALDGNFEIDHIIPLAKGGTDWPANLCCACRLCNRRKHDKMPWEFSDRLF